MDLVGIGDSGCLDLGLELGPGHDWTSVSAAASSTPSTNVFISISANAILFITL